jgi:hypothetical protein
MAMQQTPDQQTQAPESVTQSQYILVTDRVGQTFPLMIQADTSGLAWGSASGQTLGRQLRLEDRSGPRFYDFGVDQLGNLFITKQGTDIENAPDHALTISPEGALAFGTSGGPTLAASGAGGLNLNTSMAVQGFLSVSGVVVLNASLSVNGGVTLANLPTPAPAGAKTVMIDSLGNLYAQ